MNNAPKKKYSPRLNTYIKHGDVTYIVTRNLPPQTVIIDTCDVKKVNMYSWSAHPHLNDIPNIFVIDTEQLMENGIQLGYPDY